MLIAYDLVNIKPNIDYSVGVNEGKSPIFKIHVLKDNLGEVKIKTYSNNIVIFPPGSFIAGALYEILVKEMEFDPEKCAFVGYKFKTKPYSLEL